MLWEDMIDWLVDEAFLNSLFEILEIEGYEEGLRKGAAKAKHDEEFNLNFTVGMVLKEEWGAEFLYERLGLDVDA